MRDTKLKEYIDSLDENALKHQVIEMYSLFPKVKEYYDLKINPKFEEKLLEEYKVLIKGEFFYYKGKVKVKYSRVSDIIREFNEKATTPDKTVELMLYYVELGVEFTNLYGVMEEEFYINVEATFNKALNHIYKHELKAVFKNKIKKTIDNILVIDGDFKNNMSNILASYY
ncbi:hypothetical protein GOM49_15365 [Clostridium bovifaecis]|uniref:Uncharacterized protein n=1 Tax=Clostridium bovifaecis TaxID=2184719 RepID=A0A6I6EVJ5_9CLOT|nr:hypothetical protein GOM49_15365 [Clostridium bovifaecis]